MTQTHESKTDTQPAPSKSPARGGLWRELRPLLLRIHFYAGLLVGPFILIAALTGTMFLVSTPLEQIVYRDLIQVSPNGSAKPLSEQLEVAQAAVPDGEISRVRLSDDPARSVRFEFKVPELDGEYRTAFINPYSGEVLGLQNTNSQYLAMRTWAETFHSTLWLSGPSSLYSELAASWMWVIALVGVLLWFSGVRKKRKLRALLVPATSGSARTKLRSWHAVLGLAAVLGIFAVSATGLTWSEHGGSNVSKLRSVMDWTAPPIDRNRISSGALTDEQKANAFDVVLATARAEGISGPVLVSAASTDTRAWVVTQDRKEWPLQEDRVSVDPLTGQLIDRVDFAEYPFMAKMATWGIWLHMGVLFGWVNLLALGLLVAAIIFLVIAGYRMWWLRRPTVGGLAGPPTPQRPTARACLVVVVLAIGLGLVLPVLGVSLALFLALDVVRSTLLARKSPVDAH